MPDRPKIVEIEPDPRIAGRDEHEEKMKSASSAAQKLGKIGLGGSAQKEVQSEAEKGMLIRRSIHTGEASKKLNSPMNSSKTELDKNYPKGKHWSGNQVNGEDVYYDFDKK
jgi:hypothetical protein